MPELVHFTIDNDIAVITIDNPPVNALSPAVIDGLSAAVDRVAKDPAIKAAVIIGEGATFVAGADIAQFQKATSGQAKLEPILPQLLDRMESSAKPFVIALHGTTFGGGLELAQAGHYRVAAPGTQLGQPEVKLGLIPGAGGTQRLPRLIGFPKALEMCAGGDPIKAEEGHQLGLIDRIITGDLLAGVLAFAREIAAKPAPRTRDRKVPAADAAVFAAARDAAKKKSRGLTAPLVAIESVENASKLPFDQGLAQERKLFQDCMFSEQSKALVHVFFATREVSKIPDVPKDTPTIPIKSAAVVGAGTMGGGIAMVFANAGIPVRLKETDQAALDRGLATIQKNYAGSVKRGKMTQPQADERFKRITPTLSYDGFDQADIVIEAAFESMQVKKQVFGELDRVCRRGAVLATNTSSLSIDEIAAATARPDAVIGTHFFSPANVMKLLEIVRGAATSKEVIATCMALSKKLGKTGVLVGNCRGFVGNRMYHHYVRESVFLVEEGAPIELVDKALTDFGMAMGPLATGDLSGLDVGWRIRKEYRHLEKPGIRQHFAADRLCELGRFGQKTGAGWYKYDENRNRIPDPEVAVLVKQWAAEKGIPQRAIDKQEILARCLFALVNEGARILEEGIALRAGDIDIIYINGYGFPAHVGGPMWYADTVGLNRVYERVVQFQREFGNHWEPAPLLKELARSGKKFADHAAHAAEVTHASR
jgi:3-hydroxyacyl-CoA dehydrogenase